MTLTYRSRRKAKDQCVERFVIAIRGLSNAGEEILLRTYEDSNLAELIRCIRRMAMRSQVVTPKTKNALSATRFSWTLEAIELLKSDYRVCSVEHIAQQLTILSGEKVTRNMVIGKAHRLGLSKSINGRRQSAEIGYDGIRAAAGITHSPDEVGL